MVVPLFALIPDLTIQLICRICFMTPVDVQMLIFKNSQKGLLSAQQKEKIIGRDAGAVINTSLNQPSIIAN